MLTPVLLVALAAPATELPLTFDAVLSAAETHPELEARDASLAARTAREAELSRLSANPQVTVLPGWSLPGPADSTFDLQIYVSQTFDLGGIGAARRAAAAAERDERRAARRAANLDLRLAAAHAWLALWARQAQSRAVQEERDLARDLAGQLAHAASLGAALETDAIEAELFAETLERSVLDAEGETYERALDVAGALGLTGARLPSARGAPPEVQLPAPASWTGLVARASELPRATTQTLLARARRAQVTEAAASASTRLTPNLQFQWERPNNPLLFAGLTVQLPVFARNERARARAEADAARALIDARRADADAERALRFALHEVEHTRELEGHARAEVLPRLERWVAQANRRFEAGECDVFDVLRARGQLATGRSALIDAERARRWAEVKAWLLLSTLQSEPLS